MNNPMGVVLASVSAVLVVAASEGPVGVEGAIVRPAQDKARVGGCKIAAPGEYEVTVGDLIELDYTYPVAPATVPKKVDHEQSRNGAVAKSSLGFRKVTTPMRLGSGTIAFYFEARKDGTDTVTLIVDGARYAYKFTVVKA